MKLIRLYENVLREGNVESCIAKFGNMLFGDQLDGEEKNTGIENKHAKAVYKFTDFDFGENMKPEIKNAIINLQGCMSTYPEILRPKTEMVFRGTSAPIMPFIRDGKLPTYGMAQPYLYKANSIIQSWSEYESNAEVFGSGDEINQFSERYDDFETATLERLIPNLSKIKIPVILGYKATPDDFLFKGEYLNKLSEFNAENEVIRVDNKPIMTKAYLNEKWLSYPSRKLMTKISELL